MPIFKLTPIDHKTHNWNASQYKGKAIVRAQNTNGARTIAQLTFLAAYDFNEVGRMAISPG
jgi:hypothetical protein